MILMKLHARTGPVAVADLEKMLHKVLWLLGDVDLYTNVPDKPSQNAPAPILSRLHRLRLKEGRN